MINKITVMKGCVGMSRNNEPVDRFDLGGNYTHTDYYDEHGNFVGSKVDRYDLGGEYTRSDNYDRHGNQTGTSDNEYSDDDSDSSKNDGGCYITTAVCGLYDKPDDCYELTLLRRFRDNWLMSQEHGSELIDEYYNTAPKIVAKINAHPERTSIFSAIYNNYILPCVRLIEENKNEECKSLYSKMVITLGKKFIE